MERGGEVTYHGPGQLVAYPIVALASPGADARARPRRPRARSASGRSSRPSRARWPTRAPRSGVRGRPARDGHPGCWVDADGPLPRKIGAVGIRVARGVSFHGIALNVTTNLADFDLIDPCGMPGLRSTSIARERARAARIGRRVAGHPRRGDARPSTASVAVAARRLRPRACARRLGFGLVGDLPPAAEAGRERRALEDPSPGRGRHARPRVRADGRPGSSSCAATPSPAGGWPRSSTASSSATASSRRPSPSTTTATASTAGSPPATASGPGS